MIRTSPPKSSSRLGVTILAVVSGLALFAILAGLSWRSSRQTRRELHVQELREVALWQARSATRELRNQVHKDANDPGSKLFTALRKSLEEGFSAADFSAWIQAPTQSLQLSIGTKGEPLRLDTKTRILSHQVEIFSPRSPDPSPHPGLFTGLLRLRVETEARVGRLVRRAKMVSSFELRLLLPSPPIPFDQVALYVGGGEALFAASKYRQGFERLVATHEAARQALMQAGPRGPDTAAELGFAMPEDQALFAKYPRLDDFESALVFGPYHLEQGLAGGTTDLPRRLDTMNQSLNEALETFRAQARTQTGLELRRAGEKLVGVANEVLDDLWRFFWHFTVLSPDSPKAQAQILPFAKGLVPDPFLALVHRRLSIESQLTQSWLKGRGILDGGYELEFPPALPALLAGRVRGRTLLVVKTPELVLEDFGPFQDPDADPGHGHPGHAHHADETSFGDDRILIVGLGTRFQVRGDVAAAILGLPSRDGRPSEVHVSSGSRLQGAIHLPKARPGDLTLDGMLLPDSRLRVPVPPSRALSMPGKGPYVVAVSPDPLFETEEEA